jgi:hypothetical protein
MELVEPEFTPNTWKLFHRQVIDGHPTAGVAAVAGRDEFHRILDGPTASAAGAGSDLSQPRGKAADK